MRRLAALRVLVSAAALVLLTSGGLAVAYWAGAGAGTGASSTGDTLPLVLSPATPSGQLYPGGQATVTLVISSPNPVGVRFGSLVLDVTQGASGFAVDADHSGCSLASLSFTTQTNGGDGWTVPAKVGAVNGSLAVTLTNALAMSVGAANACQGATYSVHLVATS